MTALALLALLSFAIGAIPWGPILARIAGGPDLRSRGSGNPGATNVMRVLGPGWGIATLILDIGKGWLCAGPLAHWLHRGDGPGSASASLAGSASLAAFAPASSAAAGSAPIAAPAFTLETAMLVAGSAAILGHLFSPWLRFRGGKGVATAVGCYLAIAPVPALIAIAVFAVVLGVWRFVSVGSLAMAASFPVATALLHPKGITVATVLWGMVIAMLIAWRHRTNLRRLLQGTEPKIGRRA